MDWKEAIQKGLIEKQSELQKSNRSDNDNRSSAAAANRRSKLSLSGQDNDAEDNRGTMILNVDKANNAALGGLTYLDLKIKGRLNTIREEGLENEPDHTNKQDKEQQNSEGELLAAESP